MFNMYMYSRDKQQKEITSYPYLMCNTSVMGIFFKSCLAI